MSETTSATTPRSLRAKVKGWIFDRPAGPVYTASNWTLHTWGFGGFAEQWIYQCFALIRDVFTTGYGVDTRLMGWALLALRVIDGVLDPLVGHISDITHSRWGRRRPFILGSALLAAVLAVGLWWMSPDWSEAAQFAWIFAFATLIFLAYGTFSMSHYALGYELSDDYNLRSKVMAVKAFWLSVVGLMSGFTWWLVLELARGAEWRLEIPGFQPLALQLPSVGSEVEGWRWVSIVIAVFILIGALVPFFCCKERFQDANRVHVNAWKAFRATLRNRPFAIILLVRIAKTFGRTLYIAMAFFVNLYSVGEGDKSRTVLMIAGLGSGLSVLCSLVLIPLAAGITRKLNKRGGLIIGFGATFLSYIVLPWFAQPGHLLWVVLHGLIFMLPLTVLELLLQAVLPDICDVDELSSGERREGLFSAVMAFVDKLENSLCVLIGGYLVAWAGIDMKAAVQAPEAVERLRLFAFTPAIVFSGLAFALSFLIPLTPKFMNDVRARLEARRAAGG